MSKYKTPSLTVDAIVKKGQQLLLIKRKNPPFQNYWAFPGGFVDYNENPLKSVLRELLEETSLIGKNPKLINIYGDPKRDPRKHIITIAYSVDVTDFSKMKAMDDAKDCKFFDIKELKENLDIFAFDHKEIFLEYINKFNI